MTVKVPSAPAYWWCEWWGLNDYVRRRADMLAELGYVALPAGSLIRIAAFNGGADPMVSAEQVAAFEQEMKAAGADYLVVNYPGALHACTNPAADKAAAVFGLPIGYDKAADQNSWQRLQQFLADNFS
ncbi:dienelactone hydrolase family protein [Zobellella aerophila]|uniref:Dienelactone hydrolase domain-containing protein n=1 Tax=Zobellella aerophila TaxID=870480 RepID=A0ABP6VAH6_9GAMM